MSAGRFGLDDYKFIDKEKNSLSGEAIAVILGPLIEYLLGDMPTDFFRDLWQELYYKIVEVKNSGEGASGRKETGEN